MAQDSLFVDTSGWASLADRSQPQHSFVRSLYKQARRERRKFVTTNYILAELVALLTRPVRMPRSSQIRLIKDLKASPTVEIVHVDLTLDNAAWQLLVERLDKEWSLVDCSSFVIMQQRGITEALTTDHHFEQAGFIRLLR